MSKIVQIHTPGELKNLAINGALDYWQERGNNTTVINTATTVAAYCADMTLVISTGSNVKNYSYGRNTDVPTSAQSGFQSTYSQLFTMITGLPSLAASDRVEPFQYRLEGLDYQRIHGKIVTYGFWIKTSSLNTWQAGTFYSATTATNWIATSGATFAITQFSVVEGSLGFGAKGFVRSGKTIQQELSMCQRYYELVDPSSGVVGFNGTAASINCHATTSWKVPKRAAPSVFVGTGGVLQQGINAVTTFQNGVASGNQYVPAQIIADSRL